MAQLLVIFGLFFSAMFFTTSALAAGCADNSFCEGCVAAPGCSWGGPADNISCRDSGANTYSCPSTDYSIWWSLSGQCGNADANYCKGNTSTPPACSSFNGNCSSCIAQSACGYDGFNCETVANPLTGAICPAGKTEWHWGSCSINECSSATGGIAGGACTPESNAEFCSRLGKNCDSVDGIDNCGRPKNNVNCGSCTSPQTCDRGGVANVCGNPSGTPGEFVRTEICNNAGTGFVVTDTCSAACLPAAAGTTAIPTCSGSGLYCAANTAGLPAPFTGGLGCTLQTLTCAGGNSCYLCVVPGTTNLGGASGTPGTSGAPGNPNPDAINPAWIQTNEGDVHSNTKIDVP